MAKLNEMVRELRESVGQSPEGIALLLQLKPKEYLRLEEDWIPPDDLLQRMCSLFQWNYQDIKRMVVNGGGAARAPAPASGPSQAPAPRASAAASRGAAVGGFLPRGFEPEPDDPDAGASGWGAPRGFDTDPGGWDDAPGGAAPREGEGARPRPEPAPGFHDELRAAREAVGQSPEGVALLLGIPVDFYLEVEGGLVPPDDMVRRICALFSWNYRAVRQALINRSAPRVVPAQRPVALSEVRDLLPKRPAPSAPRPAARHEGLGERLARARADYGQTPAGLALLLNIPEAHYLQLESGAAPDPELLARIAALFKWNHTELRQHLNNENIQRFQPSVQKAPNDAGGSKAKLAALQRELADLWDVLPAVRRESLLEQLELIRDSALKHARRAAG